MKPRSFHLALIAGAAVLAVDTVAQETAERKSADVGQGFLGEALGIMNGWRLDGSLSPRFEFIEDSGDRTLSVYQDVGAQYTVDAELVGRRQVSPYEFVDFDLAGFLNESDFRGDERGIVVERARLGWEKGDTSVPFRGTLGNALPFLSRHTLQRALIGTQVELQPRTGRDGHNLSILAFGGESAGNYETLDFGNDIFAGGSVLYRAGKLGTFTANLVHNNREADQESNLENRNQTVATVTAERTMAFAGQELTALAELGALTGDVRDAAGEIIDAQDAGFSLDLDGRHAAERINYGLRVERFGSDYRPNGGQIRADQFSIEARAGKRLESGLGLQARLQRFEEAVSSENSTTSDVAGITANGPLEFAGWPSLSASLNSFVQDTRDETRGTDRLTINNRLNLTAPIGAMTTGRASLLHRRIDDKSENGDLAITREGRIGADRRFALAGWDGSYGGGALLRRTTGQGSDAREYGADVSLSAGKGPHRLSADYRVFFQNTDEPARNDTLTQRLVASYDFTRGLHRVSASLEVDTRDQDARGEVEVYKFSLAYTLRFSRAPRRARASPPAAAARQQPVQLDANAPIEGLVGLIPGRPIAEIVRGLEAGGITGGARVGDQIVYETTLVPGIAQRQRLILRVRDGVLVNAGLVFDLLPTGRPGAVEEVYGRIVDALARRWGRPVDQYVEGEPVADLASAIRANEFIRATDWRAPGGPIRLFLPQRSDDQVRIEARYAPTFPPIDRSLR